MPEHFDAVVVGSGFGGSVMAYRLAEAGLRVLVLERGRSYPPGSFPRAPHAMRQNFWDPSAGLFGMFNVWSFPGAGALVASGLGGGSLIYANVLIRKDEKWFIHEDLASGGYETWVVDRKTLDPHYDAVERMMNVQKYPLHLAPYGETAKTLAMRDAAQKLGHRWQLLNLAVSFRTQPVADPDHPDDAANPPRFGFPIVSEPGQENLHGVARYTCRLCGECDVGCNYGSKNTLDLTYLSAARRLPVPAEIRTLCEVRSFEKQSDGRFRIRYVAHSPGHTSHDSSPQQLTAERLILAAGTFGSNYLMLRNRPAFPQISDQLGRRYSGNGDLLSFLVRAKGPDGLPRTLNPTFGPVITSAIRVGDALDGDGSSGRGFYIEDGGFPAFLAWLIESASDLPDAVKRFVRFGERTIYGALGMDPDADIGRELAELLGPCDVAQSSLPILAMGRDLPTGTMRLKGKFLECDWKVKDSQALYDRIIETGQKIAQHLGATYEQNPAYRYFRQVLTAHPLGGCAMGRSPREGVVNEWGEVFGVPGLYVADGSVLPGPVGPNPALTIAALADRFATGIIEKRRLAS